jgi:predicted  nucleic acid-binding Zn-ribbon protein
VVATLGMTTGGKVIEMAGVAAEVVATPRKVETISTEVSANSASIAAINDTLSRLGTHLNEMATGQEKLNEHLERIENLQQRQGYVICQAAEIPAQDCDIGGGR